MLPALLLPLLFAAGPLRTGDGSVAYAVLPLRNLSADRAAAGEVLERLQAALAARGAAFVPAARLEALLRERRVRYTDSLAVEDARAIGAATGATHVLAGALLDFGRGPAPRLALGVRVLDVEGRRVQSALVALRGEDFRGWLGLGAIEDEGELLDLALSQVLEVFGPDGAPLPPPAADPAGLGRVAVLPFQNRSTRADAGATLAEILAHEWFRAEGVQVIEISELRAALVRARIRSLQEMDERTLAAVGQALQVRWFALGSVERFGEETQVGDRRHPEVEATVRLVDAGSGAVVAARSVRRRGDDGETLLGLGVVDDPFALAQRAAGELVAALGGGR